MGLLFCLFAMIAIVLSFGQAEAVQASNTGAVYVAAAVDADCDGGHPLSGIHCCAGVTCAGYAQQEAMTVLILADGQQFLPAVQSNCIGQTLRPALQPPRA
jgi:hypothetical protein